jgi:hypothetical protein
VIRDDLLRRARVEQELDEKIQTYHAVLAEGGVAGG